ncbi:hypothetical protein DFH11DRAFT_1849817 [Phellopilus nigrolimitatus]|nr:hypothetical protein DFH11DRAFT_1849817 [Phellopilus nigrolimitatus]
MGSTYIKPEPTEHSLRPFSNAAGRENADSGAASMITVKSEPCDANAPLPKVEVKKDESDTDVLSQNLVSPSIPMDYAKYESADQIRYTPENCLKEGVNMVKNIKAHIKHLELGSKLRKDVWLREIASLESQGTPSTMIAVCGATGAGKSSILNAILDDNVVPTSGMRACTAVVTEIAYHKEQNIAADVSFLSEKEWRDELKVLLDDLIDEDGQIRRATDLRSEAGVAWHKVHAVYPMLTQDHLPGMTVDRILSLDSKILELLGSVKKITAKDSREFAKEIAKYIDSKDQKRGNKKDRENDKKDKKKDDNGAALWPLIRQVNVRCSSEALSTGAVLVDLPGVADANAARSSIARDYMKKCDCIWILAPITRAVDDKTAKDLLGDAFKSQLMSFSDVESTITFIATKCDDISCSEVIRALALEDDPILEKIEEHLEQIRDESKVWKEKKTDAETISKDVTEEMRAIRAKITEHQEHLNALEEGVPFTSNHSEKDGEKKNGKKRKSTHSGRGGSSKRKKNDFDSEEEAECALDPDADDDEMDLDDFIDNDSIKSSGSNEEGDRNDSDKSDSDDSDNADSEAEEAPVTIDDVKTKIAEGKAGIKSARERLSEARKQRKEAVDMLSTLEKKKTKAQRDKNAFCSLKRSEFSRDVLKEDFRAGLKELDDAAAENRDPGTFDPTVNLRDYASIDLPVFTVSSRDYIRIKKQVKGDGDAACFSNVEETGVPELQKWCHTLTVKSRDRAAKSFRNHLRVFSTSVKSYVDSFGTVSEADRESLREKWETAPEPELLTMDVEDDEDEDRDSDDDDDDDDDDGFDWVYQRGRLVPVARQNRKSSPVANLARGSNKDKDENMNGISNKLTKEFCRVVAESVKEMQTLFKDGLEDKCSTGAQAASESAVETSDAIAASMHWATYRATLRREGVWRRNINEELVTPMTRHIASSWAKVFETNLFSSFETKVVEVISNILKEIEESCPVVLRDRAHHQGQLCIEEVKVALKKTIDVVHNELSTNQKDVSRCLEPHVREQLSDGYSRAMEERGTGSVARQKNVFRTFVHNNKDDLFEGGAEEILERLDKVAVDVGRVLELSLDNLAEKVEVNLAVLWEGPSDSKHLVHERSEAIESIETILEQLALWESADNMRN